MSYLTPPSDKSMKMHEKEFDHSTDLKTDIISAITEHEESKRNDLTESELFRVNWLINVYEFIFGFIIGFLTNQLSRKLKVFSSNENTWMSLIMILLIGIPSITTLLYIRPFVRTLPGLIEYDLPNRTNFKHPPPIALTFGFWANQVQLKDRTHGLNKIFL